MNQQWKWVLTVRCTFKEKWEKSGILPVLHPPQKEVRFYALGVHNF